MFSANSSQVSDDKLFVEDVFSTYLYTGNGSTQTITNGIDLAGKGGLIWLKNRSSTAGNVIASHALYDTARGIGAIDYVLRTNTTDAQNGIAAIDSVNSNGFTFGGGNQASGGNNSGDTYASWTFREAPKFFDVVTYTGDGTFVRQINHSLGVTPGFIVVKRTDSTGNWMCVHRNNPSGELVLNSTAASTGNTDNIEIWTSTYIAVSNAANINGATYVAYLYAHDVTSDGIIQCGSYTGNGSANGPEVNLGWEPQWLLIKNASGAGRNWLLFDNMRGMVVGSADAYLVPNSADAEASYNYLSPTATGFQITATDGSVNNNGQTFIYIAIRRGPMRTPTLGTNVFTPVLYTGNGSTSRNITVGFPVDFFINANPTRAWNSNNYALSRLTNTSLKTDTTATEAAIGSDVSFTTSNANTGIFLGSATYNGNTYPFVDYFFRRAPGFFDEVCYTGTGVARTVNHNLGVAPEFWIIKRRSGIAGWLCGTSALGNPAGTFAQLQTNSMFNTTTFPNIFTVPTATTFGIGTSIPNDAGINNTGSTYVAYLFASCPGVSKVGSYTGNGSSQTINCGFAAGARFVMIKRTDSTGDWYVWDTARGIVAGNDPHLSLNTTAAEVTTDDTIDTDSSGFVVNQDAATNVNVNAATYIYLAIA